MIFLYRTERMQLLLKLSITLDTFSTRIMKRSVRRQPLRRIFAVLQLVGMALRKNLCKFPYCDKNVILERLEMIAAPFFLQYTTDTVICQDTSDISRACRDT